MSFYLFMKYYSLVLMASAAGAAVGAIIRNDWLFAIFCVACCAINHFCYNLWDKWIKESK